jgi:hypothetical protein
MSALLVGWALALAQQPGAGEQPPSWKAFKFPASGFAMAFPGTPKAEKDTFQGRTAPIAIRRYVLKKDGVEYRALVTTFPPSEVNWPSLDKEFDSRRDATVRLYDGKLLKEKKLLLAKKYPAREWLIQGRRFGTYRGRNVQVGSRSYELSVVGPTAAVTGKDADRFLASFRLLAPQAPPAGQPAPPGQARAGRAPAVAALKRP